MTEKICPSCSRPLPADAPAGLCPVCVLTGARESRRSSTLPPLEEIRAAFPQFEILECIGHGGMGVVYKVRHPQLDRLLALKVLLPGLHADPGFVGRFTREARILARLDHPSIVAVHDFGESEGLCWLTMEYVEGVNLRQAMQVARFTPEQALAVIPELCAALQCAHDHGILHRDIKPENILLDDAGRVKIVDFGIARLTGEDPARTVLTETGAALGSASYVAPEQIEQPHLVDHRADLYSLGVVFYEMLTGELPIGRFAAPSRKSASHPRLDQVVFRTLEKEREKRYQSAAEMQAGVETASRRAATPPPLPRFISPQGLQPLPSSGSGRATKIILTVLAILAGLMLLALAFSLVLALCGLSIFTFSSTDGPAFAGIVSLTVLIPLAVISWHRLWQARRGFAWVSPGLQFLAAWLPALVLSCGYARMRQSHAHLVFHGKGDYLFNVGEVFTVSLILSLPAFWLICPSWSRQLRMKAGQAAACIAALAVTISLVAGKHFDGHWPFANYYEEVPVAWTVTEPAEWLRQQAPVEAGRQPVPPQQKGGPGFPSPVELSLHEAQRAFGNCLVILGRPGRDLRFGILAGSRSEWITYVRAVLLRMEITLPPESAVDIASLLEGYPVSSPTELPQAAPALRSDILMVAAIAGVLTSWGLFQRRWEPVALFAGGILLAFVSPVEKTQGFREEYLMQGAVPAPPKKQPLVDFSEPVAAAQSIFDAAAAGDIETVRLGMSRHCLDQAEFGNLWNRVVSDLAKKTWAAFSVDSGKLEMGNTATVTLFRGRGQLDRVSMIRENGLWRMDGLPSIFVRIP